MCVCFTGAYKPRLRTSSWHRSIERPTHTVSGRVPVWNVSTTHRPQRLLARNDGFSLPAARSTHPPQRCQSLQILFLQFVTMPFTSIADFCDSPEVDLICHVCRLFMEIYDWNCYFGYIGNWLLSLCNWQQCVVFYSLFLLHFCQ